MKKPSIPKYKVTWDVSVVLQYLASLYPLESLSLKSLTLKTIALIALATAPRAQTLVSLSLDHMMRQKDSIIFVFPNLLKTTKIGCSFSLRIEHFREESLCAMHTLLHYIRVTASLRLSRKVMISFVTHKSVCTSTIARWLKLVLELSGIDVNTFKAHSYRGAAVSAAFNKGCSLKCILDTADWTSDKNFRKFYCRQALSAKQVSFANAVFDG